MNNKKGFTLIELLVVVLIIGILSAIALPQYSQAVEKSRAAEALSNIGSFKKAVDIWKLANPGKRRSFAGNAYGAGELDISIPDDWSLGTTRSTFNSTDNYSCSKNFCYDINVDHVKARRADSSTYRYGIFYFFGDGEPYFFCDAHSDADYKLCRSLAIANIGEN